MSPQESIAHYRIVSKLGEGGMGAVWRATDTKLNRDVAIKVLPAAFEEDDARMQRFEREAQVLASLNHPNIGSIYGVEERALILELVEGLTLEERIARGPIPIEEALFIASQIAEGLEYAHEKQVVHRDLKPANIKITPDGRVKVLDFGLAKALAGDTMVGTSPMSSPTLTMQATQLGVIVGTAAYMPPEQAKGKPVDRRADIWAFAVVLYEALTGRRMYGGETVSETLAAVIKDTPDLTGLPEATPAAIRWLLRRCLEKDPRRRLRDIGEARLILEEPPEEPAAPSGVMMALPRRAMLPWAIGSILALAAIAASWIAWRTTRPSDRPLMRFSAELGPDAVLGARTTVAISRDGTRIAYPVRMGAGPVQLATRLMDQSKGAILPGTEGARDSFFSPNGQWIGFFAGDKLKKIPVQGGTALTLCENSAGSGDRGASWGEDGTIIAALDILHLFRVPEVGGKPQKLPVKAEDTGEIAYRWPQILPGGGAVLATVGFVGGFEDATIAVVSLKTGEVKKILSGGYYGRYLPSGHLIYLHQNTLFAVPFDLRRMETRGTPAPVQQEVGGNTVNGSGQLDFSLTGTLVYVSGQNLGGVGTLAWLDATGRRVPILSTAPASTPRLSPDGKRLAISMSGDIFNYDLQRGVMGRITFDGAGNRWPVWTPDGKYIAYAAGAGGIWWARADASMKPERILETKGVTGPQSFSPDGRRLVYLHSGEGMLVLPLDISDPDHPKPGKPELVESATGAFHYGAFSPDGRWLAFASAEGNSYQVYVRPYPAVSSGGKWQISTVPGRYPVWSRKRHELFYETMDGHIMITDYTTEGDTFTQGTPRRWAETPLVSIGSYPNFDMSPDGQRIVGMLAPEAGPRENGPIHATFLVNFFDELKRKLP